ncbi:DUF4864 domain-containing protein [Candidatus Saccharibacteria bacterium]|nr:MAG: DUF4864 domain-containing protein [Candidatus Saccharibacteria bacterium]
MAGVFVLLMIFANQATQGAVTASNKFINAMQAKDSGQAYGLFSKEAKETVTSEEFDAMVQRIAPILNTEEKMKDKSVTSETGKATTGKVVYEIKGSDAKTYTLTVNLVKQDDNWKVQNFESNAE